MVYNSITFFAGIAGVFASDSYISIWDMPPVYILIKYIYPLLDLSFEILLDEHATEVTWPVADKVVG